MSTDLLGFIIGILFGAGLLWGGLAEPDKIVGTLRLKDFHAFRTIAVFVLVGMLGVWILHLAGAGHSSVKPAAILANLIGGALLGVGFGLSGYCPGTGLACAAAGRIDALVTVIGMLGGAFVFIIIYPTVAVPINAIRNYGKVTLPEVTVIPQAVWILVIVGLGTLILVLTARKKQPGSR